MNLILRMLQTYTPRFLRRNELENLFQITASAFGRESPEGTGLSFEQRLEQYARFTDDEAMKSLHTSDQIARRDALFQAGFATGERLRKMCRVSTVGEAKEAMRLLYGAIGIRIRFIAEGELIADRCFFSDFYSPETCRVISALDAGVYAGLSEGGRLRFTGRITEGFDNCTAETQKGGVG